MAIPPASERGVKQSGEATRRVAERVKIIAQAGQTDRLAQFSVPPVAERNLSDQAKQWIAEARERRRIR